MCCASDTLDPLALEPRVAERRLGERGIADLRYYNGDIHRALFALPNFFRELVPGAGSGRAARPLAQEAHEPQEAALSAPPTDAALAAMRPRILIAAANGRPRIDEAIRVLDARQSHHLVRVLRPPQAHRSSASTAAGLDSTRASSAPTRRPAPSACWRRSRPSPRARSRSRSCRASARPSAWTGRWRRRSNSASTRSSRS